MRYNDPMVGPSPVFKIAQNSARQFDLLRWFAFTSLVCVVLFGSGSALLLGRALTRNTLERDAGVSAAFVESIMRAEETWVYFVDPKSAAAKEPLESFFKHVSRMPGVVRANVFSTDGTVLWSSDVALIGRRFPENHELQEALRGRIVVESGEVGDHKEEHIELSPGAGGRRFMEAYLPVRNAARTEVIGVVEIYRLPENLFETIDRDLRLVWIVIGCCAALLYGALFMVVAYARKVMATQQEKLVEAEALAAIGAIASTVAHGLRNPLASIRSSAELARMEDDPERDRCLADIMRETDRLDGWVRDLLLQAREEAIAGGQADANRLVETSAGDHAAAAGRQGVRIEVRPGTVPPVRGNPGALRPALDNLVLNAIEAMPSGGDLVIETVLVDGGKQVEIRVIDSGTGLPPALHKGLPRPFYSTKARGTGLGLVLTRRIVQGFGGSLSFDSRHGRGTSAIIALPVAA